MSVHLKRIGSDDHLTRAFEFFDKNGSGYIEFNELKEALIDDHPGPNNEQFIEDIIFDADLDKVIQNQNNWQFGICVILVIYEIESSFCGGYISGWSNQL